MYKYLYKQGIPGLAINSFILRSWYFIFTPGSALAMLPGWWGQHLRPNFKNYCILYRKKQHSTRNNYFCMTQQRLLILLFVLLISFPCFSQNNITGIWEGKFLTLPTDLGNPKLLVEIHNFKDSLFTGITHLYYEGNQYEHYKMVGRYLKKDSILVFTEASTISVDLGKYGNCLGTYMMKLKKEESYMVLDGFWKPNIENCTFNSKVRLKKKTEEVVKEPVPIKKPALVSKPVVKKKPATAVNQVKSKTATTKVVTPPSAPVAKNTPAIKTAPAVMPAKISERETDVQSILEIDAAEKDSIKVDVYDNGEIDGDSVSVYEENVPRINKKMITAKPITFYVSLNKNVNPIAHLRLVAENMGSIPPCTALMIVTTKSKRYEVRLSSNFKKNATVELFLKE